MNIYKLEEIIKIIKINTHTAGTIKFSTFRNIEYYELKIYDRFNLINNYIDIPICSCFIDKDTFKISTISHNHLLITEFNNDIISTLSSLINSYIEDIENYLYTDEIIDIETQKL